MYVLGFLLVSYLESDSARFLSMPEVSMDLDLRFLVGQQALAPVPG